MDYVYYDYKSELLVNDVSQGYEIISGAINLGKWLRASVFELVDERLTKMEVRRFVHGIDYTFEKDGVFYLWRARRCTPDGETVDIVGMDNNAKTLEALKAIQAEKAEKAREGAS